MRPADERGEMTLAQVLVSTAIFLVVMSATLTAFTTSERLSLQVNDRTDEQDRTRSSLDVLARQLRNLASPTPDKPQAIDWASSYNLVFQTVDPNGPNAGTNATNVERVRYCLGGTAANGVLYRQDQRWTSIAVPAAPASALSTTAPCPDPSSAWTATTQVASGIVNRVDGQDRPVFSYDSATPAAIDRIHVELFVDGNPTSIVKEAALSSGVFLRNQNRAPTAAFTADASAPGKIVLNGSLSSDPEGDPLSYVWWENAQTSSCGAPPCKIGTGIRFDYAVAARSSHAIQLKVYDPATLEGDSDVVTVNVP
jgi:type II secretory pathway component PulJ